MKLQKNSTNNIQIQSRAYHKVMLRFQIYLFFDIPVADHSIAFLKSSQKFWLLKNIENFEKSIGKRIEIESVYKKNFFKSLLIITDKIKVLHFSFLDRKQQHVGGKCKAPYKILNKKIENSLKKFHIYNFNLQSGY